MMHGNSVLISQETSWDRTIDIATGWNAERSGFMSPQKKDFSLLHPFQTGSGAHQTSYPMGTTDSLLG
jgi:hypothetical protein